MKHMILKVLVTFCFLFVTTTAIPFHENNGNKREINVAAKEQISLEENEKLSYRLDKNVIPIHYNLKVIPYLDENDFHFDGESTIDIKVISDTTTVMFHAKHLELQEDATTLTSATGEIHKPKKYNYNERTEIMTLEFDNVLAPGTYTLYLKYVGDLNDNLYGFYRSSYDNENNETVWLATTHFEPTGARQAFPCWDEPALKIPFNISIKHDHNYTALSNMPELEKSPVDEKDGKIWTHFQTTPPISTYLVAFIVFDFANISNEDGTIRVWCRRNAIDGANFIYEVACKAAAELEKYTGSSTRVPKMDHVAIPDFPTGAMENWGLITYSEYSFFFKEDTMKNVKKQRVAVVAAHELAHQWFGNVVSPFWWSYVWLNEGFAAYFENFVMDKVMEDWKLMDFFTVHDLQRVFSYDDSVYSQPINQAVETPEDALSKFTMISYEKAGSILRMLSHIVSEKVFQTGLRNYLNTYAYKAATPDNLWEAVQNALDQSEVPHDDFRVKEVMDTWITQTGYPLIKVVRDYETGKVQIMQQLSNEHPNESSDNKTWWVPINYATTSNPNFTNTLTNIWLKPEDESITINDISNEDWIIVNIQQTGYYRVDYDTANWKKIAKYLNSDNFENIHPVNRAQILHDAYYLMKLDMLSLEVYLEITNYLSREKNYIPWHPAFKSLRIVDRYLKTPSADFLKKHLLSLMEAIIEDTGFVEHPDDDHTTKLKRTHVFKWACTFGDARCKIAATKLLNAHLEDPVANKIPPNLDRLIQCYGMAKANETTWNKMLQLYVSTKDEKILDYMACAENSTLTKQYLIMLISEDSPIKEYDAVQAVRSILKNPAVIDDVFDFAVENWDVISSNEIVSDMMIYSFIDELQTMEQVNKLKRFLKMMEVDDYDFDLKRTERRIKWTEEKIAGIKDVIHKKQN